jgi:pyruvate,orthophosphate dikinase
MTAQRAGASMPSTHRWIRVLDGAESLNRNLVGGKAWSVNWMRSLGLPVPPAVTLTTEAYARVADTGHLPDELWQELVAAIGYLERVTGNAFGSESRPLLVSVRSGAAESMPGMMDTILNLGITARACQSAAAQPQYRRFAERIAAMFREQYRQLVLRDPSGDVPEDVWQQLRGAIEAVCASWNSTRAKAYRQHHRLNDLAGTAVTIQAMVFGNFDENSGSGVMFTRNPSTGDPIPYGQWLRNSQGEEVVSGRTVPSPISTLQEAMPGVHAQLAHIGTLLETRGEDVQDIEFTIERGQLWILQARAAKRSARAAAEFAVQLCNEGTISKGEALRRLTPEHARQILNPGLDPRALAGARLAASGEPASPGIASGIVVVSADDAVEREELGVILARPTTSPDDIHGMLAARAVITELGGATSHAAVVSRELGRSCVVGCGAGSLMPLEGQEVTVDGAGGRIYHGRLAVVSADEREDRTVRTLIEWAEEASPLTVRALPPVNAIDAQDAIGANDARDIGALDAELDARLHGVRAARGDALERDEGIARAVEAGVKIVYVRHRLPALLAAVACAASR